MKYYLIYNPIPSQFELEFATCRHEPHGDCVAGMVYFQTNYLHAELNLAIDIHASQLLIFPAILHSG
jgi:hypothetical protein